MNAATSRRMTTPHFRYLCPFPLPSLAPSRSCCRFLRSSDMTHFLYHAIFYRWRSGHHVERAGQHVEFLTMQSQHLAVHHHIDRRVQVESDRAHGFTLRERMLNVRSVIKTGQISNQAQSSDRAPAHVLHQAVVDLRLGSNHHGAAGELAVAES